MSVSESEKAIYTLLDNREGRSRGFALLMKLYSEPLYWHIRRLVVSHEDAEDVMQECFVKAYNNLDRFERRSSLKTWLYRIATNEALRHIERVRRERGGVQSYDDGRMLLDRFEAESGVDFNTMEAKLQCAILALPEKQRMVFNLRYFDEMSYEQISEVMETSKSSLKTSYHYAAEKIRRYMLNEIDG